MTIIINYKNLVTFNNNRIWIYMPAGIDIDKYSCIDIHNTFNAMKSQFKDPITFPNGIGYIKITNNLKSLIILIDENSGGWILKSNLLYMNPNFKFNIDENSVSISKI